VSRHEVHSMNTHTLQNQAHSHWGTMGAIAPPNPESSNSNFQINQAFDV